MNHRVAETMLREALAAGSASDAIAALRGRPVVLYGAGNYGTIIHRLLTESEIPPDAVRGFLDAAASDETTLLGLPVRRPHDPRVPREWRTEATVLISIYSSLREHEAIRASLRGLGFERVRSGYEVAIAFHTANDPRTRLAGSDYLAASADRIAGGCRSWADEASLETYVNHFLGYAGHDVARFLLESGHRQYFAPPPLRARDNARFIDCGAFDGDTIRVLAALAGRVEAIALFEPCARSLARLGAYLRANEGQLAERVMLFPCGVWDRTAELRFDGESVAASSIDAAGSSLVQCVAIDDALQCSFDPTVIKMDIEGAEPRALAGAEQTIRRSRPDLAISVYHALSHFWEIPALLERWAPGYRFYLRTYGAAGFETVLYAAHCERGGA
jgi:FkbM family methyltransferase